MDRQSSRVPTAIRQASSLFALGWGIWAPALVYAQEVPPPQPRTDRAQRNPDEIVVTARQRNETLISAPVAVSALGGEDLSRFGTTDVRDISNLVPSLALDRTNSGNGGVLSIRGVGTSPAQAGFDQAVSISIDGVQTGRARILSQGLFDVAQVEVLKGPQALFFGKNSPAGVLSIKTAEPTRTWEGYVRGSYEFAGNEATVDAVVSGPLSESVGVRAAVRYRHLDGYFRNIANGFSSVPYPLSVARGGLPLAEHDRRTGEEEFIGRLTFSFEPVDSSFKAVLRLSASDLKNDGPSAGTQLYSCGTATAGVTSGGLDPYSDCRYDKDFSRSAAPTAMLAKWPYARSQPYGHTRLYLGTLNASYDFGQLELASVTGYFRSRAVGFDNYDATSLDVFLGTELEKYRSISQELRLTSKFDGPVNFMLGGFYENTKLSLLNVARIALLGVDVPTGKYQSWERLGKSDGNTYSAFGQLIWNITPQVELAGGIRFTHETKNSSLQHLYAFPLLSGTTLAPTTHVLADRFRGSNWSPEATLTWRPSSDLTFYGAYKTGYKSGGFGISAALIPATISAAAVRFKPERVQGFELGSKARLLDGRLTVTVALYSYKFKDLQVNAFNPATTSYTIVNAASLRQKGVELDVRWKATDNLTLNAAVNYNRARYIKFVTSCFNTQMAAQGCNVIVANGADGLSGTADDVKGQNLAGVTRARAPEWSFNAGFNYRVPLSSEWALGFNGNARYTSKYNASETNNINGIQKGFWVLDGGISLERDDHWQFSLIGRNLTNEYYALYLFEKPGSGGVNQLGGTPARGRQILLEATWRY